MALLHLMEAGQARGKFLVKVVYPEDLTYGASRGGLLSGKPPSRAHERLLPPIGLALSGG